MGKIMKKGGFHMDAPVHDPAAFVDFDGSYYIFGTHMTAASSKDLRYWECFAQGVTPDNALFSNLLDDEKRAFSFCGKFNGKEYAVWAPDVSYNPIMKKYVMYFATSGSYVKSSICMAVADSVQGPYTFVDTLLSSGFDAKTVKKTNVREAIGSDDISRYLKKNGNYNNLAWPNCIDPNTFRDKEGRLWMVYGSWSGGIFLIELDERTGYPIHPKQNSKKYIDSYFGAKLLGGGHKSIEGPFIYYDSILDYYFLFVSFGWLARDGGYQIRLFRSKTPDGPYVDMSGRTFRRVSRHEPYGLKLMGNYVFPSMECAYKSPGHNSVFLDKDGKIYTVYHQRFDMDNERHEPRVHQLLRTRSAWLTAVPFATEGEMLCPKQYHESEVCGTYYVVEHGQDISDEIHAGVRMEFTRDGAVYTYKNQTDENDMELLETPVGSYCLDSESRVELKLSQHVYEGVIVQQNDEAGNPVMCMTCVGDNMSVWAVKYL